MKRLFFYSFIISNILGIMACNKTGETRYSGEMRYFTQGCSGTPVTIYFTTNQGIVDSLMTHTLKDQWKIEGKKFTFQMRDLRPWDSDNFLCTHDRSYPKAKVVFNVQSQ